MGVYCRKKLLKDQGQDKHRQNPLAKIKRINVRQQQQLYSTGNVYKLLALFIRINSCIKFAIKLLERICSPHNQ